MAGAPRRAVFGDLAPRVEVGKEVLALNCLFEQTTPVELLAAAPARVRDPARQQLAGQVSGPAEEAPAEVVVEGLDVEAPERIAARDQALPGLGSGYAAHLPHASVVDQWKLRDRSII